MLRSLYGKFIRVAMLAITILILSIVLIINILNVLALESAAEKAMMGTKPPKPIIPHGSFVREKPSTDFSPKNPKYYTAIVDAEGTIYGYLDTAEQRNNEIRVVMLTLAMGFVLWIAMLFLVIFLTRSSIRPIVRNMEEQKRFVTDAGHELKTPLAIIMSNLDALEIHEGSNKWTRHIRTQTQRLNDLMQDLLEISRLDEKNSIRETELFDAGESLKALLEEYDERFELHSLEMESAIEKDVTIRWYRELYEKMCEIYLDNAAKYGFPGTKVMIELKKRGSDIYIDFSNKCEKLPDVEPKQLFARFYKGDSARTHSGKGSFGVGLPMAKVMAEGQGGKVSARYEGDDTIIFSVVLKSNI